MMSGADAGLAAPADCCVRHAPLLSVAKMDPGGDLPFHAVRAPLAVTPPDGFPNRVRSSAAETPPKLSTATSPPYLLVSTFRI
jgi:hypothetical protein